MYPLSPTSLPYISLMNCLSSKGLRSSIALCECETQQFASLVADKMQLKAIEPSHRAATSLGKTSKNFMLADSLIFAHTQRRAVHEAYACAFTTKLCSEKCEQGQQAYLLKLSEPIVRNHFWEHIFHIATHFVEVEMLETSVVRRMEQNHNQHDLRHRHFAITMVVSLFSVGLFYALG